MKNHNISRPLAAILLLGATLTSAAQELNESLTVEGDYTPVIRRQERINTLPQVMQPAPIETRLPIATEGVPADAGTDILPMPVTGWQSRRNISSRKGYLDFGMGSYLNITGSAGYRFMDTEDTKAGIRLQHNSSSGFKSHAFDWSNWSNSESLPEDVKKLRTDSRLGIYASHQFDAGRLEADLSYRFARFNYYNASQEFVNNHGSVPVQNLNEADFNAAWMGNRLPGKLQYTFSAGYTHFGYHRYFSDRAVTPVQKENHFRLGADLSLPWDEKSTAGLNIDADLLYYTSLEEKGYADLMNSYGKVSLTPFYRFSRRNLNVNIGALIDITVDAKRQISSSFTQKYSLFHIAPQIKLDWRKERFAAWLHLLGGTRLNTLAANSRLDYYQAPTMQGTIPLYSPVDAELGLSLGRVAGLSASLHFDYKAVNNVPFGGLYLNFPKEYATPSGSFVDPQNASLDISGWRAGLSLNYQYASLLEVSATALYSPQDGESGYFNGYDRPRWVLDARAEINPWSTLSIGIDYQYRGVRRLYDCTLTYASHEHRPDMSIHSTRLPDITALGIGASYTMLSDQLTLWVKADNILGSPVSLSPALENEGFCILAGVGINF